MIDCIFTVDYEIYGDGEGSLRELVYEPAQRLKEIFLRRNARLVVFVEVAELEMIEAKGTDPAIDMVKRQVRDFYREGCELGLHLHPQWYNARYEKGRWLLDYSEYNLCTLPRERIIQIVDCSIAYLRKLVDEPKFIPFSFRAGNWLFQPTCTAANILAERGIKVNSSVFKGGFQHQHHLDYRKAIRNGYYWKFTDDVNVSDSEGVFLELPIYTEMVRPWEMLTTKRIGLQRKGPSGGQSRREKLYRIWDFVRSRHPVKFDFCRMTFDELKRMLDTIIRDDEENPTSFRPIVAIGHTKDLIDFETVESFLSYLVKKGIRVSTFEEVYPKCSCD